MKSISIHAILMFLIMGTAFSQLTETFENVNTGATSFMVGDVSFTTTGDLIVEEISKYGCGNSDKFLGSGTANGGSFGSFGTIEVTNPSDKFTISTSSSWCGFTDNNDGTTQASGDVKFIGTLSNGDTTIEEIFHVVPNWPIMTYDQITFSPEIWDGKELTKLEARIVFGVNYLSLDNIVFANTITTSVSNIQEEEIRIYPNPAVGEIDIIGIDDLEVEVKIINAIGRIVREQSLFNQKIDISGLLNGLYYISINTNNQQITKLIIKH